MDRVKNIVLDAYWIITLMWFAGGVVMLVVYTPTEQTMGPVQKIFYLHMPVAICTLLACLVTFIGNIGYLWQRRQRWDDLASASARVAVLLCTVVLITGMIWGKSAWGRWWTWSPRLTFSLVLWLIYVVYLVIRPSIQSRHRRALVTSVYGIVAFIDVPLVYLSVRLMPDIHPRSIALAPAMKLTLVLWFIPIMMLSGMLIASRFSLQRKLSRMEADHHDVTVPQSAALRGVL